jgi:hypothetical protein
VRDVIRKDSRFGFWAVAEKVHLDRESVWCILPEELNVKRVYANVVPKMLSDQQKYVTRNCVWTFCYALRLNQICWIR